MTLRTPPLYLQAGSHSAENDRLGLYGLVGTQGVGPLTQMKVSQSGTPAMTVSVGRGFLARRLRHRACIRCITMLR